MLKQKLEENLEVLQTLEQAAQTGRITTASRNIAQLVSESLSQEAVGCIGNLMRVVTLAGPFLVGIIMSEYLPAESNLVADIITLCGWIGLLTISLVLFKSVDKRLVRSRAAKRVPIHQQIVNDLQCELQNLEVN